MRLEKEAATEADHPKFCKDCHHCDTAIRGTPENPACSAPENFAEHVDHATFLVTGVMPTARKVMRATRCQPLREERGQGVMTCGPSGKWFKPKPEAQKAA